MYTIKKIQRETKLSIDNNIRLLGRHIQIMIENTTISDQYWCDKVKEFPYMNRIKEYEDTVDNFSQLYDDHMKDTDHFVEKLYATCYNIPIEQAADEVYSKCSCEWQGLINLIEQELQIDYEEFLYVCEGAD